jgi:hypothetical protein
MTFRTMSAKFAGCCVRCRKAGLAGDAKAEGPGRIGVGQQMRYGGRGQTYHLAAECPAAKAEPKPEPVTADLL